MDIDNRFFVLYDGGYCGVMKRIGEGRAVWVVEPKYTEQQAMAIAIALNDDPHLDPDEITRIVELASQAIKGKT